MAWSDLTAGVLRACVATFGVPITYRPRSGSPASVALSGIFRAAHDETEPFDGVRVSTSRPTLGIRLADLGVDPADGDEVDVAGKTWQVVDKRRDGEGGCDLDLQETAP